VIAAVVAAAGEVAIAGATAAAGLVVVVAVVVAGAAVVDDSPVDLSSTVAVWALAGTGVVESFLHDEINDAKVIMKNREHTMPIFSTEGNFFNFILTV